MARAALTLFCIVLIVGILYCELAEGAKGGRGRKTKQKKKPKCSRLLTKIPVHKNFKIDKFTGTWYTLSRTTYMYGDNTYQSASLEINKNADGTYSYSLTGKTGDDTCIPVETGSVMTTKRAGMLHLKPPGASTSLVTMVISFTGYKDMALVYYCLKYKPGSKTQCSVDGYQVEIISRSEKAPNKKLLKQYQMRASKRVCTSAKQLKKTTPGQCKIPDILEAAKKKKEIDVSKEKADNRPAKCEVKNIPFIKDFDLTMMNGVWYEISRTRFTFNKLESVVTRHAYDEYNDVINSLYTGAMYFPENDTVSACNTAIKGMSRTRPEASELADMQGRIGGEESGYQWVPMKIMYTDNDYLMFYACYYLGENGHCNLPEVTLVGRTPNISIETKQHIYNLLLPICLSPANMTDTKFLTNCSKEVDKELGSTRGPSDCKLGKMPIDPDYDKSMLAGTWYLYASISYTNRTLSGAVMTRTVQYGEDKIRSHIYAFSPDNSSICQEYNTTGREMCLDTGDHIVSPPEGHTGQFYFRKVLNVSRELLVEYTCSMRTLDNTCEKDGIEFNVYVRNKKLVVGDDDDDADKVVDDEDDDGDKVVDDKDDDDDKVVDDKDDDADDDNDVDDNEAADDENNGGDIGDGDDGDVINDVDYDEIDDVKTQATIDLISDLALSVCLDPKDLEFETELCDIRHVHEEEGDEEEGGEEGDDEKGEEAGDDVKEEEELEEEEVDSSPCDIDRFYIMGDLDDFVQEGIYGYWYEIIRQNGVSHLNISEAPLVAYVTSDSNETMQIFYTSETDIYGDSIVCSDVRNTILLPRCYANSNGDFLARFEETDRQITYVPFKIVYTDYNRYMLTYICEHVALNGECSPGASFIRIWSRNTSLSENEKDEVFPFADWACVDVDDKSRFAELTHDNDAGCMPGLEQFVAEKVENSSEVTESPDVEEAGDQQQQDQRDGDDDFDDIDLEMLKSDQEFYSQ